MPPAPASREDELERLWSLSPQELAAELARIDSGARPKLPTLDIDDGDVIESVAAPAAAPAQCSVVPMPKPAASAPPPPPAPTTSSAPPPAVEAVAHNTIPAPSTTSVAPRASVIDPLDVLFDGLYDLVFCETSLDAAQFCVAKLLQAVEARAVIMHHLDGAKGDFVIVHAEGEHAQRVVGNRSDESDWSLDAVARNLKPFAMSYGEESGPRLISRHATLNARRKVLVVPVIIHGRAYAAIEIIDPKPDLEHRLEAAALYSASRYADFVREHGVEVPPAAESRVVLR